MSRRSAPQDLVPEIALTRCFNNVFDGSVTTLQRVPSKTRPGGSKTLQPAHVVVAMGTGDAARLSYQGLTPQREELHKKWVTEKGGVHHLRDRR